MIQNANKMDTLNFNTIFTFCNSLELFWILFIDYFFIDFLI